MLRGTRYWVAGRGREKRHHASARWRHHDARGFTIVEMIVVVAVIVLLVAIVVPVIALAGERASRVGVAADFRSAHVLASAYASDHQDKVPGPDEPVEGGVVTMNRTAAFPDMAFWGVGAQFWPSVVDLSGVPLRNQGGAWSRENRFVGTVVPTGAVETSLRQSVAFFEHPREFEIDGPGAEGTDGAVQRFSNVRYPSSKGYMFDAAAYAEWAADGASTNTDTRFTILATDGSVAGVSRSRLDETLHPAHQQDYVGLAPIGGVLGRDW